jgi:GTP-binding protein
MRGRGRRERPPTGSAARRAIGPPAANPDACQLAAGEALFGRPWQFVRGVPALEVLPEADRPEIAFAGRSNVGKSSLINALVRQRGLARISHSPGRTQELNYYASPGVALFLVDMPGYGFARAPISLVASWTALVNDYLRGRPSLVRVLLLIDARHGLKEADRVIMALMDGAGVAYQAILTKADKITGSALPAVLEATRAALSEHPAAGQGVRPTSAHSGLGIAELRAEIAGLAVGHGASLT